MPNANMFSDNDLKHRYIHCLINIAGSDGFHPRELLYIKSQALLIGISIEELERLYEFIPNISALSLKNLSYELKVLLVRDVYTIAAIDGHLSEEEQNIANQLHLELELDKDEILAINLWLKRYWSLLKRTIKVNNLPELNSEKSSEEPIINNQSTSKEEYLSALEKLKGRDNVGVAGEILSSAFSASAGAVSAGALASFAGVGTILGSSTLGTVLGGVFVASTPIGWVIGCAAGAGALGYGLSKLCSSGGAEDIKRNNLSDKIRDKLFKNQKECEKTYNANLILFIEQLQLSIKLDKITINNSERLKQLVLDGKLSVEVAIERLNALNNL